MATLAANLGAAQSGPDGLAHGDDRVFARCWGVIADVNLYSVRDEHAAPRDGPLIVLGDDGVSTRAEGWREGLSDAALENATPRCWTSHVSASRA